MRTPRLPLGVHAPPNQDNGAGAFRGLSLARSSGGLRDFRINRKVCPMSDRTIGLTATCTARVVSSDGCVPTVVLSDDEGCAIRIEVDRDGCALLSFAADLVNLCLVTGARSGDVLLHGGKTGYPQDLGRRLIKAREDLKLPVAEVARRSGLSPSYLWRIENGVKRHPDMTRLGVMSVVLGVGLDELLAQ